MLNEITFGSMKIGNVKILSKFKRTSLAGTCSKMQHSWSKRRTIDGADCHLQKSNSICTKINKRLSRVNFKIELQLLPRYTILSISIPSKIVPACFLLADKHF